MFAYDSMKNMQYHTIAVCNSLAGVIACAKRLVNYNKHHLHIEVLKCNKLFNLKVRDKVESLVSLV